MQKNINIIWFVLICLPFRGLCETDDDFKFINLSIGAGCFRASSYVANYYNGSENNVNKISYVLGNSYWRNDIKQELNGRNFELYELPTNMRYKIATSVMARLAINTSSQSSFFIQVNQVNLIATDIFTLRVESSQPFISQPDLKQCKIWGIESRSMIDAGLQQRNELEAQNWYWFYELAFNLTNTKVKENSIEIEHFTKSIIDRGVYIPGQPLYDARPQSAIGIGLVGTIGWQYAINANASFDIGLTTYLQDINLTGYKDFNTNFNLFFRINLLAF